MQDAFPVVRTDAGPAPPITPDAILAGLGLASRAELARLLALLESVEALGLAKGALEGLGQRLRLPEASEDTTIVRKARDLERLPVPLLRHRLLTRLSDAFGLPVAAPLSSRSMSETVAALAVRVSERLSPAVMSERRRLAMLRQDSDDVAERAGAKAAEIVKAAKRAVDPDAPLPFPELVQEELLNMLTDETFVTVAKAGADADIAKAIDQGHDRARQALAAGGGWAALAAVIGQAGFAPYILAAQLSAWVPAVGGASMVSLLATLVSPATVFVGVGAIAWLGMGQGARKVRSQVAARLCVLLAISGLRDGDAGRAQVLADMRALPGRSEADFDYLSAADRRALQVRFGWMRTRMTGAIGTAPPGPPPAPWTLRTRRAHRGDDRSDAAAIAGVSAAEMLWHAAAIDPNVIAGADFHRAAEMGDPLNFALHAQAFAVPGADVQLRGYVAERLVLDRLVADGHDVTLAATSDMPGFDLIVDGTPVQVKCGESLSILEEHFATYPDIPVITNEGLAARLAEADTTETAIRPDLVTTLPGFEIAEIEARIAEALGHAEALHDPGVLETALQVGVLRGGYEVMRGRIPLRDLPAWLILDGAARGALGVVGGKIGAWGGLVLVGPAGALIFGPAAAAAAMFGVGGAKNVAIKGLMADWHGELMQHAERLHRALVAAVERRIDALAARGGRFETYRDSAIGAWLHRRALDDLIAALEDRADLGPRPETERRAMELYVAAPRLAPADAEALRARADFERHLHRRPGLDDVLVRGPKRAALDWLRETWATQGTHGSGGPR